VKFSVVPTSRGDQPFLVSSGADYLWRAQVVRCRVSRASCMYGDVDTRDGGYKHPTRYDSQTQIGRVPVVLAEEGCCDRQASKSWHLLDAAKGEAARARSPIFQEARIAKDRCCRCRGSANRLSVPGILSANAVQVWRLWNG
jgi:hypothetical protein